MLVKNIKTERKKENIIIRNSLRGVGFNLGAGSNAGGFVRYSLFHFHPSTS
jgi:hypothetical protein